MAHALENLFASISLTPSPSPTMPATVAQQPALPGCATLVAEEGNGEAATFEHRAQSASPSTPAFERIVIGHEVAPGFSILAVQEPDSDEGTRGRITYATFLFDRLKREQKGHFDWDRSFPIER